MEGVQILNQFEVAVKTVFNWQYFWIGLISGFGVALILSILVGLSNVDWETFFVVCAILVPILGSITGLLCGEGHRKPVEWETRYEVSINESVNMKDFMSKYDLLDTRGDIYIVKEK